MTYAVLAAGGTGGHVYPAIALAEELTQRGHPVNEIRFFGSERGLEARVVPEAGYAIDLLPGRGLVRRVSWRAVVALYESVVATFRAVRLLRRSRPRIVVGFGGYASLPAVVAARSLRIPVVVHDQDAHPGLANRIAVRFGARAAVSIPGTPLRGAVHTGNPIRRELLEHPRAPVAPPLVAIVGGSLGAGSLNAAALGAYDRWRARTDLRVRHVCGLRNENECRARLTQLRKIDDALDYELVGFEEHMERVLAAASVVVARAGAGTVAELAATGTPSLLVPLPGAPADHQTANAEFLRAAGAAVMVGDAELDGERLDIEISRLLAAPDELAAMSDAARRAGTTDAAARLANLVESTARA